MVLLLSSSDASLSDRETIERAVGELSHHGSLVAELEDESWYIQVAKIAGAEHYLMEHRAGNEARHVWAVARSRADLVRALYGFGARNEGWMSGFDWEPLDFDAVTGCAHLPDHHPMSGRSGVTMDGFESLPVISDEEHRDLRDDDGLP